MKRALPILSMFLMTAFSSEVFSVQGSKFSSTLAKTVLMNETTEGKATVMETTIHTSNNKELLIGVSMEAGLFTKTQVKGKNGSSDSSSADASIEVTVFVNGVAAEPGTITFSQRSQELNAVLGGVIESCTFNTDQDNDGVVDDALSIVIQDDCIVSDEEIELIQRTMSAHHFNFVSPNLSAGSHRITVEASISSSVSAGAGSAVATGLIGRGSLTVESVRAINQEGGINILD